VPPKAQQVFVAYLDGSYKPGWLLRPVYPTKPPHKRGCFVPARIAGNDLNNPGVFPGQLLNTRSNPLRTSLSEALVFPDHSSFPLLDNFDSTSNERINIKPNRTLFINTTTFLPRTGIPKNRIMFISYFGRNLLNVTKIRCLHVDLVKNGLGENNG